MKFLITGLPRIRSAWFAALFSVEGVRCFHDAVHHGGVNKMIEAIKSCDAKHVGLCDPGAACAYPEIALQLFKEPLPIILVNRNEEDCRTGLENWAHAPMTEWQEVMKNYNWFRLRLKNRYLWVEYDDLDKFDTVAEVFRICTGLALDKARFDLFNTLKIEQHYGKAAKAAQLLKH